MCARVKQTATGVGQRQQNVAAVIYIVNGECSGCSANARFSDGLKKNTWICGSEKRVKHARAWKEVYGLCNEKDGYHLPSFNCIKKIITENTCFKK